MPRSPLASLRLGFVLLAVAVAVGSGIYLAAGGARPGAPFAFVVGCALALCASLYLLARSAFSLFAEPQAEEVQIATGRRRKELEREKQLLLKALKELAFDHEMRKISDGDYEEIAGSYRARAVRILRQLDEGAQTYRKEIDEEMAARRRARKDEAPAREAGDGAATGARSDGEAGERAVAATAGRHPCASCGAANEPDAVFCKRCGQKVVGEAAR